MHGMVLQLATHHSGQDVPCTSIACVNVDYSGLLESHDITCLHNNNIIQALVIELYALLKVYTPLLSSESVLIIHPLVCYEECMNNYW